jgi:hypothetical protein
LRPFCATVLITLLMPVLSAAQTKAQPATAPQPAAPAQATTPAPTDSDQTQTEPTTASEPTTSSKPWWKIWKRGSKAPKTPQATTPAPTDSNQTQTEAPTPPKPTAPAQIVTGTASDSENQGWTGYVQFQSSFTNPSISTVLTEALSLGYNLTPHLGFDAGIPLITTRSTYSPVTTTDWLWTTLMGEPWLDAHYTNTGHGVDYLSVFTVTFPPTNETRTFTTGRFNGDWFNHLEHNYNKFTPFLNLEASNGTINFYYLPRPYKQALPYQTLGFMGQAEAGGSYQIFGKYNLGVSGYALVPAGPQKVYSRLVPPGTAISTTVVDNRYFNSAFLTQGPHFISEDYGVSAWVELPSLKYVSRYVGLQVAYTYSAHHHLNILTVMINFNGTALFRKVTGTGTQ